MKTFYMYNIGNKYVVSENKTYGGETGFPIDLVNSQVLIKTGYEYHEQLGIWSKDKSFTIKFTGDIIPHRAPISSQPHGFKFEDLFSFTGKDGLKYRRSKLTRIY